MSSSPKQQVTLIAFSTLLAGFSLFSIVSFTDPQSSSWITFGFFYLSLLLLTLGIITLIGLGLRQWLKQNLYIVNLADSFRQGLLIAILVVISFLLLSNHLLFWWVELSLILFFAAIEAFLNLKI